MARDATGEIGGGSAPAKRLRLSLATRLVLILCGVAAFSTGLALVFQDRSLSQDLERAARERLERAAQAADRLVDNHLETLAARYRAISGTPQLRATLELGDAPTLAHYAESLARQQGAARVLFLDAEGRAVAEVGDPALAPTGAGVDRPVLISHRGQPFAVVMVEPGSRGRSAGRLVAIEALGEATVAEWSELCGAQIVFTAPGPRPGGVVASVVRQLPGLEMRVEDSLEAEQQVLAHSRRNLLLAGSIALAAGFVVSFFVSKGIMRPIHALRIAAERVGDGDLTVRVESGRSDELGDVALAFGSMTAALRQMAGRVVEAADRMEIRAGETSEIAEKLATTTAAQARGIEQGLSSMNDVKAEVSSVASSASGSADVLASSAQGSSNSLRQLLEAGEELNRNAVTLSEQLGQTGHSIEEMSASTSQIGSNSEELAGAADDTSASMEHMADSTRQAAKNAREAARLSHAVVEISERGRARVQETVGGMKTIQEATRTAQGVIGTLGERVKAIGEVVDVIDGITGHTDLLALNASIIASQAGEHGRAFAVVAGQMKALADHVRASTRQIEDLVGAIRKESEHAVDAIGRGSEAVGRGVDLASESGQSLDEITRAARESGDRTEEIVTAMEAQQKGAEFVVELMQRVRSGVEQIRTAVAEQSRGTEHIVQSASAMKEVAHKVQGATESQARGTAQIGHNVELVRTTVEEIKQALLKQSSACLRGAKYLELAHEHTHANAEAAAGVGESMRDLRSQAESLRAEVQRFRI